MISERNERSLSGGGGLRDEHDAKIQPARKSRLAPVDGGKAALVSALIVLGVLAAGGGWFLLSKQAANDRELAAADQRLADLQRTLVQLEREKSLNQTSISALQSRNEQQLDEFQQKLLAKDAQIKAVSDRYEVLKNEQVAAVAAVMSAQEVHDRAMREYSELEKLINEFDRTGGQFKRNPEIPALR